MPWFELKKVRKNKKRIVNRRTNSAEERRYNPVVASKDRTIFLNIEFEKISENRIVLPSTCATFSIPLNARKKAAN